MSETDLAQFETAWESASDADVLSALSALADYPLDVHPVIEAEAKRRCISLDAAQVSDPSQLDIVKRGMVAATRLARARPFQATMVLGATLRAFLVPAAPYVALMHWGSWLAIHVLTCSSILLLICWPCRTMRTVVRASAGGSLGSVLVVVMLLALGVDRFFWRTWYYTVSMIFAVSVLAWALPCGFVCGVVWFRNRYRPVYPAGHCKQCGYNLRGLPVPRCPECGKSFDIKELQT